MNLANLTINDFWGILFIFSFLIWLLWIIFNGIGVIKDLIFKK